jgi:hypothetical protein
MPQSQKSQKVDTAYARLPGAACRFTIALMLEFSVPYPMAQKIAQIRSDKTLGRQAR